MEPQVLSIFLDCRSGKFAAGDSATEVLGKLAEEITNETSRNVSRFRREPVSVPPIDREEFQRDPHPAFARWLDGVELALGGRQFLLCLDDYEELEGALASGRIDGRFLSLLRNIIQHHRCIIMLLAGGCHLDELPPHWADALGTTQLLKLGFLDETDARELIVQPVKGFPEIYQPEAVERILVLTHSQPYLVQLLCGLLVEKMNREDREPPASQVNLDDVDAVISPAIERGEIYFNSLWRSQSGDNLAWLVLERLASSAGQGTSAEIKELTDDQEALRETVRTLLRRDIIERTADGYRIFVPMIGHYVRSRRYRVINKILGPQEGFSMNHYDVVYDGEDREPRWAHRSEMAWGEDFITINEEEYRHLQPSAGDWIIVEIDRGELKTAQTFKGRISRRRANAESDVDRAQG